MVLELYMAPASPHSRAVQLTLGAAKKEYKAIVVDVMKQEQLKPDFLKINPQHTVPVLKDGSVIVTESRPAMIYVATGIAKDEKLYPKSSRVQATINSRLFFDAGTLCEAFGKCVYPVMFKAEKEPSQDAVTRFNETFNWANDMVKPSGYAAGTDHITIADLSFLATISTADACGLVDWKKFPELKKWFDKCRKSVPDYDKNCGEGAKIFGDFYKSKI